MALNVWEPTATPRDTKASTNVYFATVVDVLLSLTLTGLRIRATNSNSAGELEIWTLSGSGTGKTFNTRITGPTAGTRVVYGAGDVVIEVTGLNVALTPGQYALVYKITAGDIRIGTSNSDALSYPEYSTVLGTEDNYYQSFTAPATGIALSNNTGRYPVFELFFGTPARPRRWVCII